MTYGRVQVELPLMLTGRLTEDYTATPVPHPVWRESYPAVVEVLFGDTVIATLKPSRESNYGHGDDSSFREAEEREITEETVAAWLRERLGS